ncbi:MAG: type II toxin-antitoxin system VapC family toxin [Anaerolineaceae bacterium]
MILVDTSVWVDHFRSNDPALVDALESGLVLSHPFVVGEIACGNVQNRTEVMRLLTNLPIAPVARDSEILALIEARRLMGRGIGYIDAHLLASAALSHDTRLWTRDRRLAELADRLDLAFHEE